MKQCLLFCSIIFSALFANAQAPDWLKSEVLLVREAAVAVAGASNCATKSNVLGQIYVLSRIIQPLSLSDNSYGKRVYALAILLESYGLNARFIDACSKTDEASFNRAIEILKDLYSNLN